MEENDSSMSEYIKNQSSVRIEQVPAASMLILIPITITNTVKQEILAILPEADPSSDSDSKKLKSESARGLTPILQ